MIYFFVPILVVLSLILYGSFQNACWIQGTRVTPIRWWCEKACRVQHGDKCDARWGRMSAEGVVMMPPSSLGKKMRIEAHEAMDQITELVQGVKLLYMSHPECFGDGWLTERCLMQVHNKRRYTYDDEYVRERRSAAFKMMLDSHAMDDVYDKDEMRVWNSLHS